MEEQRLKDSAQRIVLSKERTKLLLERAEGLVASRFAFKTTGGDTAEEMQQRAFNLRTAIATRETLKGELEQHKARRGRLTELHNELNVAEEEMCAVKLDINEHEMALDELYLKIADVENHMNVLINDLTSLRDQLPKLYETEGYHRGQVDALGKELLAAKEMVEKKRQMVVETEANLNFLMNVGMSSVMWSEAEKQKNDNVASKASSIAKRKWSTVGKVKGEDIIYDADLTPRTADWGKKQRESKVKYMWRVVFHAMKLGYLTNKIPFPPEAFARMMNHIHGSNDAETIRDLHAQLSNTHRIVQDQTDAIKKLERLVQVKGDRFKEAELKHSAIQQKYEKLRVEAAALRKVMATMEDKSVSQLQKENELYEVERRNLYGKLYGRKAESSANLLARKSSFSVDGADRLGRTESFVVKPVEMDIPIITESKHLGLNPLSFADGATARMSPVHTSSPRNSSPSNFRRVQTLTSVVLDERVKVAERVQEFNGPSGTGFLQQQLDRYVAAQKQFDTRLNSAQRSRAALLRKLELAEGLAMHAFDSFARNRQSVEEELEEMMVHSQKVQKLQLERYVEERRAYETRISKLESSNSTLERDFASTQAFAASLESQCGTLMETKDALEDELRSTKAALDTASSVFAPDDLGPINATIAKINSVKCQDLVDYDTAIGRILPMKSQRNFTGVVTQLSAGMQQSFLFICSHLRRLFETSLRRTALSVTSSEDIAKKLQEQFETLIKLSSGIGRIGLDAIESWDAFKREQYKDAATDVDDLPQPPPVYIEKPPPPSAEVDTQTVESSLRVGKNNMSSQTAVVTTKTVSSETTITLGKGSGDGLGFVSSDKVKRMEELLKAKIREADDAHQRMENIKQRAARRADRFSRTQVSMNKHAMHLEDIVATASTLWSDDLAHSCVSVHDVDQCTQVDPVELLVPRDAQTQYWMPDARSISNTHEQQQQQVDVVTAIEGGVCVVGVFPRAPLPDNGTQTEEVVKKQFHDAEVITEWTAATFAPPTSGSDGETAFSPHAASQTRPTFNIAQLITLPPTPTGTMSEAALSPKSNAAVSGPSSPSMLSPHRTGSMRSAGGGGVLSLMQHFQSQPITVASPTRAAVPVSHAGVQTDFSVGITDQTVDLAAFEAFCGAVSGRSATPPEPQTIHVPVVDEELTAKTIAEFEASLETRLVSEFGQHRQYLEEELDAKAKDYDRQHQQVDRDALKLRLRVSDMQQNYEAIAASVTKFKFAAKQLEEAKAELQQERTLRQEAEKRLADAKSLGGNNGRRSSARLAPSSQISTEAAVPLRGGISGRNPSIVAASQQSEDIAAVATNAARRQSRVPTGLDPADAELMRTLRRGKDQLVIQLESLKAKVAQLEQELEEQKHQAVGAMSSFLQRGSSSTGLQTTSTTKKESFAARTLQQHRSAAKRGGLPSSPTRIESPIPHGQEEPRHQVEAQRSSPDAQAVISSPIIHSAHNFADATLVAQLQQRINDLQLQLLSAHKDIMETRSVADRHQHSQKETIEALQRSLAQSEAMVKKSQSDEVRAKNDLLKERAAHNDSVAMLENTAAETQKKATKIRSDLERQVQTLQKQHEAAEKSALSYKQQFHASREALEEVRGSLAIATAHYASKARAAASLVSQLHCALVESAVAIKSALVLENFQLADPMMGETAVKVMRMLVEEDEEADVAAANDQLLDMSKYLGDRDVDLLRRMTLSVKHFAGVATIASAESSRPTTREAGAVRTAYSTPHAFALPAGVGNGQMDDFHVDSAPLPMTPRRHPPTSQFLGGLIFPVRTGGTGTSPSSQHPQENLGRMEEVSAATVLPHIQLQSRSPTRRPVFNVKLAEGDKTFSLFSTSSAIHSTHDKGIRGGTPQIHDTSSSRHALLGSSHQSLPFAGGRLALLPPRPVSTPPELSVVNGLTKKDVAEGTHTEQHRGSAEDSSRVLIHGNLPSRAALGSRKDRRRIVLKQ